MPRTARPIACAESTDALRREYLREPDPRLRQRLLVVWTYRTEGRAVSFKPAEQGREVMCKAAQGA